MGGFFGAVSRRDCVLDIFFGADYHSHLGTRRGGMVIYDQERGFQRQIHNIENTPFRTKFEKDIEAFRGCSGIGCISDTDPQPLLVRSHLGLYAIAFVGIINNAEALVDTCFSDHGHQFMAMSSGKVNQTELVAALISQKETLVEGIRHAQELIDGSATILLLTPEGILAARDGVGRLPILVGKGDEGCCVSFESFAYHKLGYADHYELGPGEIVRVTPEGVEQLAAPGEKMKICAFLWTYYGYPNSNYEGKNVEVMRYRNGAIMARDEAAAGGVPDVDYVAGVPDSGLDAAIGYANESGIPYGMCFIKNRYVGRTFIQDSQEQRERSVRIKLNPLRSAVEGKRVVLVDDSIVRGTTSAHIIELLRKAGAKEVHMRISSPPFMHPCYFGTDISSREYLIACRMSIDEICKQIGADSLGYLSLESLHKIASSSTSSFCDACFTGNYPIDVPQEQPEDRFSKKLDTLVKQPK